jgi:hypothetical protein
MGNEFDDIPEQGFGALAGGAAETLDRVTTKVVPTGIETVCVCGRCGVKNQIAASWQEVLTGSVQLVPADWGVDRNTGTLYPNVYCAMGGCRYMLKIGYAPSELHRYVLAGIEQGYANPQEVSTYLAQVKAAAGRR